MKELKKGDFTGIYSSIDGKPLYFTGVYSCMEYDGMPCVFLATDLHNNLTFCRWSQQDLNKRGFTIPPEPVRISKTAMQMIQKAGAVIRWTTAAERKAANTDHKRMSAYIITTAAGDFYTTGTCADVREILKAAQAAPLPEESTPATEANQDTTTGAQDGPTAPESNTAGENTTGANNAPEEATQRPKRRMAYIVECRSPRGSWTAYSAEQSTHEAAEKIKEEAESRHALTPDGAPIFYRLVTIDKGPEAPLDGPTTAGTIAAGETPTATETAPQEATSDAGTAADNNGTTAAEKAPERPETSTPAQDTTGSDTRPPRATEEATTGRAAGDTSTPANQEPGTAAGYSNKAQQDATPCDIMRHHATPGHACEIAPGRTETTQAEHVPTATAKSPPRAKTRAGRRTSRASPKTAKNQRIFVYWIFESRS